MTEKNIQLEKSWLQKLQGEFDKPYMQSLKQFLSQQKKQGKVVFPPGSKIFNALDSTPYDKVRVVILGQDPYHGPGQAHGLSFSVPPGVKPPPSLVNIFKEQKQDLGIQQPPGYGCLEQWASQGVLLLNSVLTVESGQAASHRGKGWEQFTDVVVSVLNDSPSPIVFMLWGSYAQKKGQFLDESKHLILKAPHPSPLSAHRGFLGCCHFSKANDWLVQQGLEKIEWQLSV